MQQLLATFVAEAQEHLQVVSQGVLALEQRATADDASALLAEMFRAAHSLKGAARAVGAAETADLAHALESVMGQIRAGALPPAQVSFDLLYQTVDALGALVNRLVASDAAPVAVAPLIQRLTALATDAPKSTASPGSAAAHTSGVSTPTPTQAAESADAPAPPTVLTPPILVPTLGADESVRVANTKLDAIIEQVGELQVAQLANTLYMRRLQQLVEEAERAEATQRNRAGALRGAVQGSDNSFAATADHALSTLLADVRRLWSAMQANYRHETQLVDDLGEAVLRMRLMPVASVLEGFPRMVRDLAHALDKRVRLTIEGGDTEIDRSVLEQIKAPLTHLLRNAVDHGIEAPAARSARGKPAEGHIRLKAAQRGSMIVIEIDDDGAGIDGAQVRASALARGVIDAAEATRLNDHDLLWLIFRSGMSTRRTVTDISGRGVGLDVVRDQVERLRGYIDLASTPGQGTRFALHLPLSVATTLCLLIESSAQVFAIPTSGVLRVARVQARAIGHAEGRDVVHIGGRVLALHDLSTLLALTGATDRAPDDGVVYALLLGVADQRVAIAVDAVHEVQELVVKPLPQPLSHVQHIAGASNLGTGEIALVLNVADLVRAADQRVNRRVTAPAAAVIAAPVAPPTLLIADDSFTTRSLERNILETAGYHVVVAADGLEAWTLLQSELVELVVSDVMMPHMNGFELTRRIRGDTRFSQLPVILVTAQEAPADREQGLAAGADAYLVKSAFDQDTLLSTVARLL